MIGILLLLVLPITLFFILYLNYVGSNSNCPDCPDCPACPACPECPDKCNLFTRLTSNQQFEVDNTDKNNPVFVQLTDKDVRFPLYYVDESGNKKPNYSWNSAPQYYDFNIRVRDRVMAERFKAVYPECVKPGVLEQY